MTECRQKQTPEDSAGRIARLDREAAELEFLAVSDNGNESNGGHEEMRPEESLAAGQALEFESTETMASMCKPTLGQAPDPWLGQRIGRYMILRQIGREEEASSTKPHNWSLSANLSPSSYLISFQASQNLRRLTAAENRKKYPRKSNETNS